MERVALELFVYYMHSLKEIKRSKAKEIKGKCNERGVKVEFYIEVYMLTR